MEQPEKSTKPERAFIVDPTALPGGEPMPECGHSEWTVGCPRCWQEVVGIAKGVLRADKSDGIHTGAIYGLWHMIIVVENMRRQLTPMTRSIDLSKSSLAQHLITNLDALVAYMSKVVREPGRVEQVVAEAAALNEEMLKLHAEEKDPEKEEPNAGPTTTPSGIIITG